MLKTLVAGALAALLVSLPPDSAAILPPIAADSLAGVVARIAGGDSARVGTIRWRETSASGLGAVPASMYNYRPSWRAYGDRPVATQARAYLSSLAPPVVWIARGWTDSVAVIKHELVHVLLRSTTHDPAVFARVETYTGR